MSEQTAEKPVTKRKGRSPNYPGIDLKLALERARTLWAEEQHNAAATSVIMKHWGYGPKSGGGAMVFAALKRFGLLEDAGPGSARLTARAQKILLAERESRRDDALIREAALLPPIHKEMRQKYPQGLPPSDEGVKFYLTTERGFTPNGAADFLSEYKRTMNFAGLLAGDGATLTPSGEEETPGNDQEELVPPAVIEQDPQEQPPLVDPGKTQATTRTVQVTYSPTQWALLQAAFPMTEQDWDAMIAVLEAMKRGLVAETQSD